MSYTIKHYDGTVLINLIDGVLDTINTDLSLVGKNYSGFGEAINNNFVKLLENFSSPESVPPTNPLTGQIWYNKTEARLKVYDGAGWKGASGTVVQDTQPPNLTTGDIWIDSTNKRMFFYDGVNLIPASKQYNDSQLTTATQAETIYDSSNKPKSVLSLYVNNIRLGIFSSDAFTIQTKNGGSTVNDFTSLVKGFNIANSYKTSFVFDSIVSKASNLIDALGNLYKPSDFLLKNGDMATGKLTIKKDDGITVGDSQIGDFKVNGTTLFLENTVQNGNIQISTNNALQTSSPAVFIDARNQYIGVYKSNPSRTLDVAGDVAVSGLFSVARISSTTRDTLIPQDGDIIYNTTTNKFQGRANGSWVDLN
jgi:hypothetical protein